MRLARGSKHSVFVFLRPGSVLIASLFTIRFLPRDEGICRARACSSGSVPVLNSSMPVRIYLELFMIDIPFLALVLILAAKVYTALNSVCYRALRATKLLCLVSSTFSTS